ncbi:LacI family DNA-binding transcriptional regulator [Candidatus Margulisiibacteriota bacterium]
MSTLKDIAKKCGVSTAAVSLALNHPQKISREVREKIYAAIKETGYYKPKDSINRIGVVFNGFRNFYSVEFYNEVIYGVLQKCADLKIDVRIMDHFDVEYSDIHDRQGFVFVGRVPDSFIANALKFKMPFVNAGHPSRSFPDIPCVYYERAEYTKVLVEFLLNCGHKNIALLTSGNEIIDEEVLTTFAKVNPYFKEEFVFEADVYQIDTAEVILNKLLSFAPKITAVMCTTDLVAYLLYMLADKYKIKIPEDISVTGYDGITLPRFLPNPQPRLATVCTDPAEVGRQSVELLYSMALNLPVESEIIKLSGVFRPGNSVSRIV